MQSSKNQSPCLYEAYLILVVGKGWRKILKHIMAFHVNSCRTVKQDMRLYYATR